MAADYTELLKNLSTDSIDPDILARLNEVAGATRDQLTGLMDYRSFSIKTQESVSTLESAMLVSISIDYLQELNLVSGWVVGDIALCSIAHFLKEPLPEGSYSAKISGSTFITFFNERDSAGAKSWLKNMQQEIAKIELPGLDILPDEHLTISGGIFPFTTKKTSIDNALIEVKKRLKFAQSQGGSAVSLIAGDAIDVEDKGLDIVCSIKQTGSKETHDINVIQVNMHGLSFESPQPFMVREQVDITMEFEDNKITFTGEIGWRRSAADGSEYPFNVGVKFSTINDSQQTMLESLMSRG